MLYGKRTTIESWHNGKLASTKHLTEEKFELKDKADLIEQLLHTVSMIEKYHTKEVTIKLVADPVTHELKRFERTWPEGEQE